ncbi:hypothetical protein LIER_25488 [Lithospermum erythrorhizon]|uniref:Uncharacterized protein n=1 Tax=Lithospermum erythrorhizon TaxID=34254 RepID=A0AAV3R855_LITER
MEGQRDDTTSQRGWERRHHSSPSPRRLRGPQDLLPLTLPVPPGWSSLEQARNAERAGHVLHRSPGLGFPPPEPFPSSRHSVHAPVRRLERRISWPPRSRRRCTLSLRMEKEEISSS